ncbi:MAG: HPr(Ser) kinase/phosphatase [bacterium]
MSQISVGRLLEELGEELHLEVLAGRGGLDRAISDTRLQKNGLALTGFLPSVHPERLQVWSTTEVSYLTDLPPGEQAKAVEGLFALPLCAVLVTGGLALPDVAVETAGREGLPLLRSQLPGEEVFPRLLFYLERHLAPHARLHGVLVDLYGVGVLIQGKSGIGKSECALHLVTRGHRLVADDVVDIHLHDNKLIGRSPDLLKHHMEVRGLGVLNLKDLFGVVAIRYEKDVDMIVELRSWSLDAPFDRLGLDVETKELLGHPLPLVSIPVAPGRNVPTLIEIAARNQLLRQMGYFSAEEFSANLTAQIALESVQEPPKGEKA